LRDLIHDPKITIDEIAAKLDAMSHDERREAASTLGRADQRLLYDKAADRRAVVLDDFVPQAVSDRKPVHHWGRNTLPLPRTFKHFEKRFCRPEGDSSRLFGYNEGSTRGVIGPGYFVAYSTLGKADWIDRGSVVIDYFQVPDGSVAEGWPQVVPNSKGLQMFVFKGTRDFMRGVSTHLTVGAAYKGEKKMGQYFLLLRQDAAQG
jgi:hypothetical protein